MSSFKKMCIDGVKQLEDKHLNTLITAFQLHKKYAFVSLDDIQNCFWAGQNYRSAVSFEINNYCGDYNDVMKLVIELGIEFKHDSDNGFLVHRPTLDNEGYMINENQIHAKDLCRGLAECIFLSEQSNLMDQNG